MGISEQVPALNPTGQEGWSLYGVLQEQKPCWALRTFLSESLPGPQLDSGLQGQGLLLGSPQARPPLPAEATR